MSKLQQSDNMAAAQKRRRTTTAASAQRKSNATASSGKLSDQKAAQAAKSSAARSQAVPSKITAAAKNAATQHAAYEVKGTQTAKPKAKKSNTKRVKSKRKKSSKLLLLIRTIFVLACLLLSWCLFAYYVIIFNEQQPLHKNDAGIILGAALWNEQPSPALKERLDYAIDLYEQGLFDYFILSGGKPQSSRGLSEAEGMKAYLMNAGIAEEKLLLETQSRDTYENILFSARVAEKNQLSSSIIITHNYHTKRAEDIAQYIGFSLVQTAGVKTKVLNESYHYTREMLAYTKWQLNKLLMPLGLGL